MTKLIIAITAVTLFAPGPLLAKGCSRGAIAGGVAGHYAHHHAIAGAVAGCAASHYCYKHKGAVAARPAPTTTKTPMAPVMH